MTDTRHARKSEVRIRQAATGENYTTALAAIQAGRPKPATEEQRAAIRDRGERYDAAEREARAAAEPAALAAWNTFGESFPPYQQILMVLQLPTGESATWYTYSTGGRELAVLIDQHARAAGFGLADYRELQHRHQVASYSNGPLGVSAWDLTGVFEDIEAGRGASEQERARIEAEQPVLHRAWLGFHDDSGASVNPPENIDFVKWGLDD